MKNVSSLLKKAALHGISKNYRKGHAIFTIVILSPRKSHVRGEGIVLFLTELAQVHTSQVENQPHMGHLASYEVACDLEASS